MRENKREQVRNEELICFVSKHTNETVTYTNKGIEV